MDVPAGSPAEAPGREWLSGGAGSLFEAAGEGSRAALSLGQASVHAQPQRRSDAVPVGASFVGAAPQATLEPAHPGSTDGAPQPGATSDLPGVKPAAAEASVAPDQHAGVDIGSRSGEPASGSKPRASKSGSQRGEESRSLVGNLLSAMGRSVAAWLPPALWRALDTRSDRGSEDGGVGDREEEGAAHEQVHHPKP